MFLTTETQDLPYKKNMAFPRSCPQADCGVSEQVHQLISFNESYKLLAYNSNSLWFLVTVILKVKMFQPGGLYHFVIAAVKRWGVGGWKERIYYITKEGHITYRFHIGDLDQRAEHMSQMQAIECRSML